LQAKEISLNRFSINNIAKIVKKENISAHSKVYLYAVCGKPKLKMSIFSLEFYAVISRCSEKQAILF